MVQQVVVVGAGVTGLVAARQLAADPRLRVTCLEASDRVGGQLRTEQLDGAPVDVGAEAIHLGAPHVAALVRDLGLADHVVGAAAGGSLLVTRKGLRPLPAGVGPTGPTRIWPVLRSGILTPRALVRAGLEPLKARRRIHGDLAVGAFTTWRFGHEVTATFVDPLLGNLHGGDVSLLSLQSTAPQLVPDAENGTSLLLKSLKRRLPKRRGRGRVGGPTTASQPRAQQSTSRPSAAKPLPMFATWPGGLVTFTQALAEQSQATVRTGCAVEALTPQDGGWQVRLVGGEVLHADHVLLTTPADVTSRLLADLCPAVSRALAWVVQASVATVVLGWSPEAARGSAMLREANGVLLPSRAVRTMKAATNLSRKWPWLPARHHLVRASVGRARSSITDDLTDEQMVAAVAEDLHRIAGTPAQPEFSAVHRWPGAMPQLQPGHAQRIRDARRALAGTPGLHIAGCGVDGLGIGSTVRSGQNAARAIIDSLPTEDGHDH